VEVFGTVVIVVALVAIVVACLSYIGSGDIYRALGKTGMSLDQPDPASEPVPGSPAAHAEAREEVRQLVVARNERRVRRGEEPLDIESEVDRQLGEFGA